MRLGEFFEIQLRIAMSVQEAKDALGFKPSDDPTKDEIAKAYKNLAFRHHPDRGGDPAKMVEINVAKDVLEGKQKATAPATPTRTYQPQTWTTQERKPPPPEHISFEQAMRDGKIPTSGIEWKFKTDAQYGRMSNGINKGFVLVGKKTLAGSGDWVFVKVHYYSDQGNMFEPKDINKWYFYVDWIQAYRGDLAKKAPKKIRELWTFGSKVPNYNAKCQVLPEGLDFKKAVEYRGRSMSFKNTMQAIGEQVPEKWKGKINITLELAGHISGLTSPYKVVIIVNGTEYPLSDDASQAVKKSGLLELIFGTYYYDGSRKVLTKMRGAKKKKILGRLHDLCNKMNQRTPLINALNAAHDQATK